MDQVHYKDNDDKNFYEFVEKLSDRELQEKQANYLFETNKNTKRIKNNVVFFFYSFVVSIALTLLVLAINKR
jgi:hypothetical protein